MFTLAPYYIEVGDDLELVEKLNDAMAATADVVNGFITAHTVVGDEIDWTDSDWQERVLSADTTFTFAGVETSYVNPISLLLTPGTYTPTFPAAVRWPLDVEPAWVDGLTYLITFVYVPSAAKYLASWIEYDLS